MEIPSAVVPWQWRRYEKVRPLSARTVMVDSGDVLIQACSTQYLGIPWDERAAQIIKGVTDDEPTSHWCSFGSNYLGGTHEHRLRFESQVSTFIGSLHCLAFASGWAANFAISEAIGRICDLIISDKRSHNSVIRGLANTKGIVLVVDLNSTSVDDVIGSRQFTRAAVLAPSIEGITGESVHPQISPLLRKRVLWIRDECHTFGAIGEKGTEGIGQSEPDVRVLGFSKSCGVMGSVVAGPANFIDVLSQLGSPWIFSTSVPPILWAVNSAVFNLVLGLCEERRKIRQLAERFRKQLRDFGVKISGEHHITGVYVSPEYVPSFEQNIRSRGYFLKVSQFPSRPPGSPCVRVCFTPAHTFSDVDRLANIVAAELHLRV